MKYSSVLTLFVILSSLSVYGQYPDDTSYTHYSNATSSSPIPYSSGWGYSTGQAQDKSIGKAMYFSLPDKSPATIIKSVLFDIETFNYSALDSFEVVIWEDTAIIVGQWPGIPGKRMASHKYAVSDIDTNSTQISSTSYAAYNLVWDIILGNLGGWNGWIGINYEPNDSSLLALRATANGDFNDYKRVVTIDSMGDPILFKTAYNLDVALAIFPVYEYQASINENASNNEPPFTTFMDNGLLIIHFNKFLNGPLVMSLNDINGRVIKQKTALNTLESSMNISNLSNGIYILTVTSNSSSYSEKVVLNN